MNDLAKCKLLMFAALITVSGVCHGEDAPAAKPVAKPAAKLVEKAVAKPIKKAAVKAPAAPVPFWEWAKVLTQPRVLVAPVAVQVEAVDAIEIAVPAQAVVIDVAVEAIPQGQEKAEVKAEAVKIRDADVDVLAEPVVEAFAEKIVVRKNGEPDVNLAMIQQITQQYRPILTAELAFIRQACGYLAEKDRKTIRKAGEASLREVARQYAAEQALMQRPQNGPRPSRPELKSPRTVIRQGLNEGLKNVLTEAQWKEFSAEFDERLNARKNAVLLDTVARLDVALHLNAAQRDKIRDSLNSAWQDKWEEWLMIYMYNDLYYPMIPDNLVVTHLNPEQKSIWPNLQKIQFGFYEQFQAAADDWWGPEPAGVIPNGIQIQGGGFF